ncbi:MAG: DUF302 domain-containing protein, partial [Candidatus Zixiibacteriota bacterium]
MNENMGITVESKRPITEISERIERISPEKGFRVLAVHNVQETLAGKGFKVEPLKIFEVCNAGFAYKAIQNDISVAMFMPCKIVVREAENKTTLTLVRPSMIAEFLPEAGLNDMAADVEKQLLGIMDE